MAINHTRYTKVQLYNSLATGDFNTPPTGKIVVRDFLSRSIDYAVQHNPTAVYKLIKQMFGKDFPNWQPNSEFNTASQESMSQFLQRKLDNCSTDEAATAFVAPFTNVPFNPKIDNWTNPID